MIKSILSKEFVENHLKTTDKIPEATFLQSIKNDTVVDIMKILNKKNLNKNAYEILHEALKEINEMEYVISLHIAEKKAEAREIIIEAMQLRNDYNRLVEQIVNRDETKPRHILMKENNEYEYVLENLEERKEAFFIKHNFRSDNLTHIENLS